MGEGERGEMILYGPSQMKQLIADPYDAGSGQAEGVETRGMDAGAT
jgi:hypothetical protein